MLFLNSKREEIKAENPDIKVTEIAKKGGEMWKELKDKSKWEEKTKKLKEEYQEAMKNYNANGGSSSKDKEKKTSATKKKETNKESPTKVQSGSFKSKEYISDDSDSENEDTKKVNFLYF